MNGGVVKEKECGFDLDALLSIFFRGQYLKWVGKRNLLRAEADSCIIRGHGDGRDFISPLLFSLLFFFVVSIFCFEKSGGFFDKS